MNNKVIIGIIVAVIVIGGGFLIFSRQNSMKMNMQKNTPTTTQSQATPSGTTSETKNSVEIKNYSFSPSTLTVKVGDSVTWTNNDSVGHSATADDNSFDTGVLQQGQSGSVTFKKVGTYTYHCSVHPNMKATIVVQ
jgi:plastocyanin